MRKKVMRLWAAILCASMILGSVDVPASVVMASPADIVESAEIVADMEKESAVSETEVATESEQEAASTEENSGEAVSEQQTGEEVSSEESESVEESTEQVVEESSESIEETVSETEDVTEVETTTVCEVIVEETQVVQEATTEAESSEVDRDVEKTDLEEQEDFVCSGDHEMAPELLNNMQLLNAKLNGSKSKYPVDNASSVFQGNGLMPSTGNVKSLVIMVDFADATFADSITEEKVNNLFFGEENKESEVYPRESLSAWYNRSSYGKLNVTGEVVSITLDNNKSYYEVSNDNPDGQTKLLNEVWEKTGALELAWEDYDSDGDQYVDAPCLIIAGASGTWASQWWSNASVSEYEMECGYKPGHYVMCMEDSVSLDASTIIHEYGHILGLPDLYAPINDSFSQIANGIATWDMMATNTGDFNGFCKMLLGWIDAEDIKTIQGTSDLQNVSLQPYAEIGELAVLYTDPENTSLFSEYFLVQYLDPDKNNDAGAEEFAHNSLRIYHVNAEIGENNYFKYSNSGDGLWLIRYVDKDRYEIHGDHVFFGTGTFYHASYTDTDCEYTTGDAFTPYTTPSTASHPSSGDWSDPYEYTGLHMEEIVVNNTNATFQAYYEEEAQDVALEFRSAVSNEISVQGANKIIISNREIWQNDSTITAYMRKKGETEKSADVSINLNIVHYVNESFAFRNLFYAFNVIVDSAAVLESGTTYEMVFPAGMFVDSLGKVSEEVIVELQTEGDYWETDIKEFEFDSSIYHSVSKTFALTTEGNIAVICEKVNGEVYLCIINPDTNQMISEVPITYNGSTVTGEIKTDSELGYAITNVTDMGCTENGTYWMAYRDPWENINVGTVKIYIFGADGVVKQRYEPLQRDTKFIDNKILAMAENAAHNGIYYDIDELKSYVGGENTYFQRTTMLDNEHLLIRKVWDEYYGVYSFGDEQLIQEKEVFFPGYNMKTVIKNENGYSVVADEKVEGVPSWQFIYDRAAWEIETDENFIFRNAKKRFDSKGIEKVEKVKGGFLLYINDESYFDKESSILYDENFNRVGEIAEIGDYDNQDDNVRLIGQEGEYNYIVDYNVAIDVKEADKIRFYYRVSKPIIITNEEESIEEITLSDDIVFDENNKVIIYVNDYLDIDVYLAGIKSVAGESYDLIPYNDVYSGEYYLVVTNAEGTYRQYYQTVIIDEPDKVIYTVFFNTNGGSEVASQSVEENGVAEKPIDPTREGYKFLGWYLGEEAYDFATPVTKDITLNARWEELPAISAPRANIISGSRVEKGTEIILNASMNGTSIYYTLDGTEPSKASILYTVPIVLTEDTIIKAIASKEGYKSSKTATFSYTVYDPATDPGDVSEEDMPEGGIAAIPQGLWIAGIDEGGYTYTGKAIKPEVRVYDHKTLLTVKKDYTISYKNNTKAADASADKAPTITVKGKGNYSGTDTKTFAIVKKSIEDSDIKVSDVILGYNKRTQKPVPAVTWNGKKLANKKDFIVSYPDATVENPDAYKEAGTYRIEVKGNGNYNGTVTAYVTITNNTLMSKVKVAKIKNQPYTGGEIKPVLSVSYKGDPLTEGKDYTVTYENNVAVGKDATVILTGKNTYAGEKRVTFKITGDSIKKADIDVKLPKAPYVYTGSEIRPELEITFVRDGKTIKLEENKSYTAVYMKNTTPGTAVITITGINDFNGTVKKTFKIKAYDINADAEKKISVIMPDEIFYEKGGSRPKPVVAFGDTILTEGKDYTLSYKRNSTLNDGKDETRMPTVTIKGKGCFIKTTSEKFCIAQKDISEVKISVPDKVYNTKKNGFKSTPVLTDTNGKKLKAKTDYLKDFVYTYAEDTVTEDGVSRQKGEVIGERDVLKVGTFVNVTVTGNKNYTKDITGQYRIVKADIAKTKAIIKPQDYTGKAITLTKDDITVKQNGKEVAKDEFAIVGYENNIKKGTAKVTIKGVGETYGGTKTIKFTIRAKGFKWWK